MNGKQAFFMEALRHRKQMIADTRKEFREIVQTPERLRNLLHNSLMEMISGPETVGIDAYTHSSFMVTAAIHSFKELINDARYNDIIELFLKDFEKLEAHIEQRLVAMGGGSVAN
jgi:hypothetical protein